MFVGIGVAYTKNIPMVNRMAQRKQLVCHLQAFTMTTDREQTTPDTERENSTMNEQEKKVIEAIIRAALEDGLKVTICDGEDYSVKVSRDFDQIMAGLGHCEEETIMLYNNIGENWVGSIYLVYGNDPDEVVNNYGWTTAYASAEERIATIVKKGEAAL